MGRLYSRSFREDIGALKEIDKKDAGKPKWKIMIDERYECMCARRSRGVRFIPRRQLKFHISISCDISYNMSGYRAGLTDDVILYFAVNAHLYRWHNYQYI